MRFVVSTLAVAAALAAAAPASAAQFLFTYSGTNGGSPFLASGTLTTTDTTTSVAGRQAYRITGVTGTRNGAAITGLVATGTDFGSVAIDNYLYVAGPYLTAAGFGFSVAGTGNLFNSYYFGNAYQEYVRDAAGNDVQNTSNLTFTLTPAVTAVPEPATWGLMILGFAGIGATLRRRSVKVAYA